MNLVIVESPTKAKTISKFLGKEYIVESSYGHVRDLPKTTLGIDIEQSFKPEYSIIPKAKKHLKRLKQKSKQANNLILATDEDREGEAIAYHLKKALKLTSPKRIVFHEITNQAIQNALKRPREINMDLVNAQQARRILDRLVGYKLSPFLWKKVARGLSAGRVQSVAVRLIVERQKKIDKFEPKEYWSIQAKFQKDAAFTAKLIKKQGKTIPKLGIKAKTEAEQIIKDLKHAKYVVTDIQKRKVKKNPPSPFTTSSLQQNASYRLGFSARKTMVIAQQLYEQGHITYHRTDSLNLAESFLNDTRELITKELGKEYITSSPRRWKTKSKGAQEAHEAIRPTYVKKQPKLITEKLNETQYKLYNLIWQRAVASQMKPAILNSVSVDIQGENYLFRSSGQQIKFDGFLKIYPTKVQENILPLLEKNDQLKLIELKPNQHFTKPPAPYSEAKLIKALEEYGIGRPSTYAPILSTIQGRNYVVKRRRYLYPTEVGTIVNNILVKHFPKIVNLEFTAQMEKDLDKIAQGKQNWKSMIKKFYEPFAKNLKKKYKEVKKISQPTDKKCPKCNHPLVVRVSRYGKFLGCSNYPKCKYIEKIEQEG